MGRNNYYGGWAPYVPVAERRRKAERMLASLKKKGHVCQPVVIEGRTIARTFWGKNWCDNLEAYSDYENRLPRGRTYARNGSVVDLQIAAGKISALVSGSEIYEVAITVKPLEPAPWKAIIKECAGKVASLVELLQGRLSHAVMEIVTRHGNGLFPVPTQIGFRCSCPDSASMCKHVAAVLYGIGARLDKQPELLFLLRQVDPQELILQAGSVPIMPAGAASDEQQRLQSSDLSSLFGIELDDAPVAATAPVSPPAPVQIGNGKRPAKPRSAEPASVRKATSPSPAKKAAPRAKRAKLVTASELIARGIPRHMLQRWLNTDVLLRTEQRGVYQATGQTEKCIERYLNR